MVIETVDKYNYFYSTCNYRYSENVGNSHIRMNDMAQTS